MKRLTTDRSWKKASEDLENELGYSHIWKRLNAIEDVLGNEYNLDQLREALKKQSKYEAFMKDWEVLAEIAGAVRKAGAKRAAELVEADRDGRCVVLPCKVGDTVYVVGTCKEIGLFFDDEYLWPEESSCPFEDSCDAEECEENHIRIFETLVTDFWIGEQNENHPEVFLESISEGKMVSDFGKTVFRDKEEAEAALERMKGNG